MADIVSNPSVRAITASAAVQLIKPGMTVFVQGSIGQPLALMEALSDAGSTFHDVHFVSPLTPGVNRLQLGAEASGNRLSTFFDYRELRQSFLGGRIDFVPLHYSDIASFIGGVNKIDIALIQLSAPSAEGMFSTGLCADFVPDILEQCGMVIAEMNRGMPWIEDGPKIPPWQIDHLVEVFYPLPVIEPPLTDAVTNAIARNAASLVRDGDTLQFGVGRVPQQVLSALGARNDLGLHSGLITPAVRPLITSGAMNGRFKKIDPGKHVTGAAIGDQSFYDWLGTEPAWAFRPVSYTHGCGIAGAIDNFVAINSVLEVDLFGQANAEMAAGRQISGSGGLVDFVRAARRSCGGRAIICLPSASPDGSRSNIVPLLGSPATLCRTDMHFVVTEFGTACLAGASIEERARALIAIAAPQFRDALYEQWNCGRITVSRD